MGNCNFCGESITAPVYRRSVCPQCGKDLKICLNCEFYSPGSQWDCHETIPEAVRDKERANFCDYFRIAAHNRSTAQKKDPNTHREKFNSLFND